MPAFLTDCFASILRHRGILVRTTVTEVRRKFAGSIMGIFWMVMSPITLMSLYALIYLVIFRIRPIAMSETDYVLYIFCGLMPFLGFMEALNAGSFSLSLNKAVLLNTVFPSELVPVRAVLAAQGPTAVGLVVTVALALALGKHSATLLLVPVIWFFLILFVTGLVWVLSLVSLVLQDIQQVLVFLSTVLLITSPIAYTVDMAPGPMKVVVYANPLSYFLIALHEIVVFGRVPPVGILGAVVLLGLISFGGGYWVFQRAKRVFFNYV
jgi:homopolymeric O-antigen transport system permease protein